MGVYLRTSRIIAFLSILTTTVAIGYAIPYPDRWDEKLIGMNRLDAWQLLGVPDIVFPEKFDGWNRDALFGAWVLTIRFQEDGKIFHVEKKFDWGFDYISWDDNYRKQWDKNIINNPRSAL